MLDFEVPIPTNDGTWVSEKHMRIAELIREYDKQLDVVWIPPAKRLPGDKPFAVTHIDTNGKPYIVCYADELDGSLLERIYQMDAAKKGNILSDIEARNMAVKALMQKEHEDRMAEAHDISQHVLKSKKSEYTVKHGGRKLTFTETGRGVK